ncbi:MAG: Stp1/IreP family PP2C-type Ser/Thr phosphatase, partial [Gammaproteobacteria bacterium]
SIGCHPGLGIAVLADGMGGHKGGEVASALAVDAILSSLKNSLKQLEPGGFDENTGYSLESMAIENAIKEANQVIYDASRNNTNYEGMGTTVVVLLFYDNRITIAHVGDSRLYRMRENNLEQLTRDHTLIQELVDRGFYSEDDAQQSMNKNLVTRAVGVNPEVEVDLLEDVGLPQDIYLLCSDGLTDMLDDHFIEDIILDYKTNLEHIAKELIKQANANGGRDNISALLAMPTKAYPASANWISKITDLFS